jgi:DNA-binding NarL/FixJ family response regulator
MRESPQPGRPAYYLTVGQHAASRQSVSESIRRTTGMLSAGDAPSIEGALNAVRQLKPALVVLDMRVEPGQVAPCRRLRDASPGTSLLSLSPYVTERDGVVAILAGIGACVAKEIPLSAVLREAVLGLKKGAPVVSAAARDYLGRCADGETGRLFEAERRVLRLILAYRTDSEIARLAGLSPSFVSRLVASLTEKVLGPFRA